MPLTSRQEKAVWDWLYLHRKGSFQCPVCEAVHNEEDANFHVGEIITAQAVTGKQNVRMVQLVCNVCGFVFLFSLDPGLQSPRISEPVCAGSTRQADKAWSSN